MDTLVRRFVALSSGRTTSTVPLSRAAEQRETRKWNVRELAGMRSRGRMDGLSAVAICAWAGITLIAHCGIAFAHEGGYEIRSTEESGGALAVTGGPHGAVVVTLTFCNGGDCLYENAETTIHTPEDALSSPPRFALTSGTRVALEIVDLDDGASIKAGGNNLDRPAETAILGTAPALHVQPTLQVTTADGIVGDWHVWLRFTDPDDVYASSDVIELVLTNEPNLCGDGHVDEHETCDAGEDSWGIGRACTDECEWLTCGDPDGDGQPRASDALLVLGAAVGTQTCDQCLCDVDASGGATPVTGVDALRVLGAAIGIGSAALECPPCQ
jgi:hypothetical protein